MKILHIIPNLSKGGAERLVIDIVRTLAKKEDVIVKLLLLKDEIKYDISEIRDLIEVVAVNVKLSIFRKNNINVFNLENYINTFKPDIIHTHLFEAELASRLCTFPDAQWFTHCHDNMVQFKNLSLKTFTDKSVFTNYFEKKILFERYKTNNGTYFIAISNNAKEYFENKISNYPISLLLNAVDFNKFFKPKNFCGFDDRIKLINVGSFVDKKNQKLLIEIAKKLKDRKINFEIHFLGDGKNKKHLEETCIAQNLEKNVFFHGNVNNVEEYLWESDMYIHTATYEPLGLVLIEAMAAGLPVVTLDGGGNRDLIEEGKNGYMIYEQKPELFVDKIIELWQNKEKYQQISTYAQQCAQQYDIEKYVDKLLNLYQYSISEKTTL